MGNPTASSKGLYELACDVMFRHEDTRPQVDCGDDLIIWPDQEHCYAADLAEMGHKSDDYIRVHIDTDAFDIISCEM